MSRRLKMQSITPLSKYLIQSAELTEQENGIYSFPIPHITAGMQANIDLFGHPKWRRDYLKPDRYTEALKARWQKAIGSWDDKIVVDIGCGPGNLYATVGGSPSLLIGVDISQGTLEIAQEVGYLPLLADAHHLPFVDAFADLVVLNATLHHCDEMAKVLAEAARLVRPGGMLVTDNDPQVTAWKWKGLGLLLRKIRQHRAYWIVARKPYVATSRQRLATEIHNQKPGDGITTELYYQVLKPLDFTVTTYPHNHNLGAEVLQGELGRAPWTVRVPQRLSGIDPNSQGAAQSIMCIAERALKN